MTYSELVEWILKAAGVVGLVVLLAYVGYFFWDMAFGPDDGS